MMGKKGGSVTLRKVFSVGERSTEYEVILDSEELDYGTLVGMASQCIRLMLVWDASSVRLPLDKGNPAVG